MTVHVLKLGKIQVQVTIALFGDLLFPWGLCGVCFFMFLID